MRFSFGNSFTPLVAGYLVQAKKANGIDRVNISPEEVRHVLRMSNVRTSTCYAGSSRLDETADEADESSRIYRRTSTFCSRLGSHPHKVDSDAACRVRACVSMCERGRITCTTVHVVQAVRCSDGIDAASTAKPLPKGGGFAIRSVC